MHLIFVDNDIEIFQYIKRIPRENPFLFYQFMQLFCCSRYFVN